MASAHIRHTYLKLFPIFELCFALIKKAVPTYEIDSISYNQTLNSTVSLCYLIEVKFKSGPTSDHFKFSSQTNKTDRYLYTYMDITNNRLHMSYMNFNVVRLNNKLSGMLACILN